MRRLMLLIALVASFVVASTASANQARPSRPEVSGGRQGPISKLVELERRKNEWLRQKFAR
jgi:hypothetical protein